MSCLCVFVCGLLDVGTIRAQTPAAAPVPGEATSFTHNKHVPEAWAQGEPERLRDCRGCHAYGGTAPHDPQAVCTRCHFTDAINNYQFDLSRSAPGFDRSLAASRTPGTVFKHALHLNLECRTCHPVLRDAIEAPDLIPTLTGFSLCNGCHGSSPTRDLAKLPFLSSVPEDKRAASRQRLKTNLVDVLNRSASMGPNKDGVINIGPFRHADHILGAHLDDVVPMATLTQTRAGAAGLANCASCHQPVFEAGAAFAAAAGAAPFATFQQTPTTCGACHIADEARTPLVYTLEPATHASRVAGTFSHRSHLGAPATAPATGALANADGYTSIQQQGCAACHAFDRQKARTFAVRDDRASFAGCQSCHDNAPWAPAEHQGWWLPRDHGNWQACVVCHAYGEANLMKARPMAEVRRRSPGRFRILTQAHPFIAGTSDEVIAKDCKTCHRRAVPQLPSRVRESTFQHSTHLPLQPTPDSCSACHGNRINGTTTAAEIGRFTTAGAGARIDLAAAADSSSKAKELLGLDYDPNACAQCHRGSAPIPEHTGAETAAEPTRTVVEFSHAGHVGKVWYGGPSLSCLDCHGFDRTDPTASITTLPTVLDCSKCHDHGDRAATSSGVTAAELRGCVQCHGKVRPLAAPGTASEVAVPGTRITDIVDGARQFHPAEQACMVCHVTATATSTRVSSTRHVKAIRTFYTPPNETKVIPAVHRGKTRKLPEVRTDCFYCHWTKAYTDAPGDRGGTTNPETETTRRVRGDDLGRYPGGD